MSTQNVKSNSKKKKKKYHMKRTLSDESLRKKSDAKLAKDTKQLKRMSRKSIIKHCKQYNLTFDGDKDKAIDEIYNIKKKQSKEKKSKKSKKQNCKNVIEKKTKKNIRKHIEPKNTKKIVQKNNKTKRKSKKTNKKNTKTLTNNQPDKPDIRKKSHSRQPSLSQSETTQISETDETGYTVTMTTPITLIDDDSGTLSARSSLSDNFIVALDAAEILCTNQPLNPLIEHEDIYQHTYMIDYDSNISLNTRAKSDSVCSIIALTAQAPKMIYDIPNMRSWNTIRDMKLALPINVESGQCKVFYGGKELEDNHTLAKLKITDQSKVKLLLSWRNFKPDPNAKRPQDVEHEHMNALIEIKKINDFAYFNKLINETLKEIYEIELGKSVQWILHSYCICLSGNRTYERKWTELHTICYDYQGDVGDVERILKEGNLYIDAWPHSGYDTPLRLAISNHLDNANVIDLVEFLVLNGARRMIRQTVFNLKRNINDLLYKDMDIDIRQLLIAILAPYVDDDPFKGTN